jgi:hypothetical protein
MTTRFRALFALIAIASTRAESQSAGFVVTLGADTVQVERVTRSGNRIEGTVVLRTPTTVRVNYATTLDASGRMARHEQWLTNGDGAPIATSPGRSIMTVVGDSLQRESGPDEKRVTIRAAGPPSAFPLGTIPVGTSFGIWEAAIARLRAKAVSEELTVDRVQAAGGRLFVSRTPVLFSSADSVDMDYFGQGRAGFKFDRDGRLIRSDWAKTTYQIKVVRVSSVDIDAFARAWTAQDQAGHSFGRLSSRDTVRATIGKANLTIDYSRPSRRGREIWGALVPWDKVWRLGADMATQITTDVDLVIGTVSVPAGSYTLWMRPSPQAPELIVSSAVNVFGTQYNPAKDFARIPLTRNAVPSPVEKLTISMSDALSIEWGDAKYSVPVRLARP